jgi:hypothetical protein
MKTYCILVKMRGTGQKVYAITLEAENMSEAIIKFCTDTNLNEAGEMLQITLIS